ncbi:MAG: hypothetical protein WDN45_13110 [Caulobacteraceae bacterium]
MNSGVALVGAGYTTLTIGGASTAGALNATRDKATWNVPAPAAGARIDAQLDWWAIEPMQPTWVYDATIDVQDAGGAVMPAQPGDHNPATAAACKIGPMPPHLGNDGASISIF